MSKTMRRLLGAAIGAVILSVFASVVLLVPASSAGGPVSCGPCSEPFENEYGQTCWLVSCSNNPNQCGPDMLCMDFGPGGGGGGDS